jgi:murein DD-endopeptidase MepM/ murein hydrolase activator NlpD
VRPLARESTDGCRARRPPFPLAGVAVLACLLVSAPASAEPLSPAPPSTSGRAKIRPAPGHLFAVCPVDRPHHFIDDFGDARYFGGYHSHTGIDIMAPGGTPVRAPFSGFARTTSNPAGGLGVYVEGRKGFVYNAHLSRRGKLGKVRAGAIVGYVGNSGNAQGSSPHNHFEWHPKGGPAVNPFDLLKAACATKPKPDTNESDRRSGRRLRYLRMRLA